ncbi:hybrid sensor histidine kinase/response regulator [Salinimicrobium sp. TH3]|uniref:hybrid sensor histidine kinase/response regulator n=1 Tax=Salinimicrobium sp. TH3 TaxID=2997342 RepID=UPI00227456F2|nr:ATP-binding protein [Salinimicrobium sp. TH3]MCY2686241.1 ATP-binding protein [Salinimicrobium sp. TH3]
MAKKKASITFTVFAGYIILATLMGLAVWFIYHQVEGYTSLTERSNAGNQKLLLVGEAATKLYEAESLSRKLIQTGNLEGLDTYNAKIDSIKFSLASLQNFRTDSSLDREIDSINKLLSQKTQNLEELLELRARGETDSYYARVLSELQRVDENFESRNYDQRFKDLQPHQRQLLIKLLEYTNEQNPNPPGITIDSLVNSVKSVLGQLETQERQYRMELKRQEDQLLANEIQLNNRLRTLLSTLEAEERMASMNQVEAWQDTIEDTSTTILFLGIASLLVILTFVFLVVKDVSRSQQYRQELEAAKTYAESLLSSREQFMNTVTHDLRSPLNTVIGYTGLLEKSDLNKSQNRYLRQLKQSSNYLLRLVNDLLDLSRLEAGKMSIEELAFNPKNLIEETVENAVPPEKPRDVEVIIDIAPDLDRPVITDPFRLKQILINLVNNACKFTPQGSVEVKAWLRQGRKNPVLCIQVKDTGIGISTEQKEKVFEEFSQEDSSIEKRYGGTGLGLAISKKLTDLLEGKINLESEPGKGSTFLVEIPVEYAASSEPALPAKALAVKDPEKISVLIVDDEPAQLGLLKELIRNAGMSYRTAQNGKEALKIIKATSPHLVLTDIQMPKMDGFELLRKIRKDPSREDLPVIALSGQPDVSAADYLKKGFSGSLLKPYSSQELLKIISDLLDLKLKTGAPPTPSPQKLQKGYTLSEIRNFAGEDSDAMDAILTAFIESTRSNLLALELAYQKGQKKKVSAVAHKMLPMFRQLQVPKIVEKLAILENVNGEEYKNVNVASLAKEINELLENLQEEITG